MEKERRKRINFKIKVIATIVVAVALIGSALFPILIKQTELGCYDCYYESNNIITCDLVDYEIEYVKNAWPQPYSNFFCDRRDWQICYTRLSSGIRPCPEIRIYIE